MIGLHVSPQELLVFQALHRMKRRNDVCLWVKTLVPEWYPKIGFDPSPFDRDHLYMSIWRIAPCLQRQDLNFLTGCMISVFYHARAWKSLRSSKRPLYTENIWKRNKQNLAACKKVWIRTQLPKAISQSSAGKKAFPKTQRTWPCTRSAAGFASIIKPSSDMCSSQ